MTCSGLDFAVLFDEHYNAIAGYLLRRVDRSTAEELAAQTFLEAYDRRATYEHTKGQPRAWLFGITMHLLHHHFRSDERRRRAYARAAYQDVDPPDLADDAVTRLDARASAQQIAVALASLPKADYDVLTLHLWAELSHREIATALRIPVGTVKSRLNRARREVRAQLGPATRWR